MKYFKIQYYEVMYNSVKLSSVLLGIIKYYTIQCKEVLYIQYNKVLYNLV